jgi:hypothetical protein
VKRPNLMPTSGHPAPTRSRVTMADGRSPGSRVTTFRRLPRTRVPSGTNHGRFAAYSCGGSHGFGQNIARTAFPFDPQVGEPSTRTIRARSFMVNHFNSRERLQRRKGRCPLIRSRPALNRTIQGEPEVSAEPCGSKGRVRPSSSGARDSCWAATPPVTITYGLTRRNRSNAGCGRRRGKESSTQKAAGRSS